MSPDGTRLVFKEQFPKTGWDLMVLTLDNERNAQPLAQTAFAELDGEVSPDGRWLAYQSNESGRDEVYVRPFPDVGAGRWQVSNGGGADPLWAHSGLELFYRGPTGAVMAALVERSVSFAVSTPARLFDGPYYAGGGAILGRTYDVSPDDRRFLMIKVGGSDQATSANLVVVQHWTEALKRLVPAN